MMLLNTFILTILISLTFGDDSLIESDGRRNGNTRTPRPTRTRTKRNKKDCDGEGEGGSGSAVYGYYRNNDYDHAYSTDNSGLPMWYGLLFSGEPAFYVSSEPGDGLVPIYKFFSWNLKNTFLTTDCYAGACPGDVGKVYGGNSYMYQGILGYCFESQAAGTVPLYHYYVNTDRDDLYQTDCDHGFAFCATTPGQSNSNGHVTYRGIECYVYESDITYDEDESDERVLLFGKNNNLFLDLQANGYNLMTISIAAIIAVLFIISVIFYYQKKKKDEYQLLSFEDN